MTPEDFDSFQKENMTSSAEKQQQIATSSVGRAKSGAASEPESVAMQSIASMDLPIVFKKSSDGW